MLLLLTTGNSLKQMEKNGHLSRELNFYQKISDSIGKVYIYSYGKNEDKYVKEYPNIEVLSKFWFIPERIKGKKYYNAIYNLLSIIIRYNKFRNIDIVKTNQFRGADFGCLLKKIFKCKLIIRMGYYYGHFLGLSSQQFKLEKKYFTYCDKIFITEQKAVEFVSQRYGLPGDRVICMPNHIDTKIFYEINIEKTIDILYVGRLEKRKNVMNLVESLDGLNYNVLIIGSGTLKQNIENYARELNMNISIIDKIDNDELVFYYNKTKLFVLPSFYEGNPKVLLEAMACSCACIGTDVPGINNIIKHKYNGYICYTNKESIRAAIMELMGDVSLRNKLCKNAKNYITKNYTLDLLIKQELSVYNDCL